MAVNPGDAAVDFGDDVGMDQPSQPTEAVSQSVE
jgi:hypothetical protein